MTKNNQRATSKTKTLFVYSLTIIIGYALFIIPDIFFRSNQNKWRENWNKLVFYSFISNSNHYDFTSYFTQNFKKRLEIYIGLKFVNLNKDVLLGLLFGALWTFFQFVFIIPNTGGANRADINGMLNMYDGSIIGTISFISLGVIGGGITEELFNRGYFINILKDIFKNPKTGIRVSVILSILTFSLGHMPKNSLDWFDILIPTTIYTLLFISTRRLTASIVAHGIYNMSAIVLTYYMYY